MQMERIEPPDVDSIACDTLPACAIMVGDTLELIGGKWAAPVILALFFAGAPLRYSDLMRAVPHITPKEMARQLRQLEQAGLVGRRLYPAVPPRVDYWLTDLGRSIQPAINALAEWTKQHGLIVAQNRAAALAPAAE